MKARKIIISVSGVLLALVLISVAVADERRSRPPKDSNVIEGSYIVVFKDSVGNVSAETEERERRDGFKSELRFKRAIKGFSAKLSPGQVKKLRDDPEVDFVTEDRKVKATGKADENRENVEALASGETDPQADPVSSENRELEREGVEAQANVPLAPGEPTPPTGTRRIRSATTSTARQQSNVNVAVIDTGIDLDHPDLNASSGTNCINPSSPADDDNGHGTHVAGSVAAKNNGSGVVGVAPNTKTYAVKVLAGDGSGSWSSVICGIDWVTANRSSLNIGVANMSLGGGGAPVEPCSTTTDPMHQAICSSTAAGVNYVVAAGNSGWDFDFAFQPDVPAAYPQVLTTTAVADSDGQPGGSGGSLSCTGDADDSPAGFSNFAATSAGEAHTIAAPGACIKSTWPGGGYKEISGTSMASPHMAAVVALCIDEAGTNGACKGKTPAQVIAHMRADAQTYNTANPSYGFMEDPLHSPTSGVYYGFLTRTPEPVATGNIYKSDSRLVYLASDGKINNVTFSLSSDTYTVKDTASSLVAGPGCSQVNANTATCSSSGVASLSASARDGNDTMSASAADVRVGMNGGPGDDTLTGGPRTDTLDGHTGADVISGLGGTDTATYVNRTSTQPVNVTIDNAANDGQSGEGDNVKTDVENLIGGAGNDTLTGSNVIANRLDGRLGADVLSGLTGADSVSYADRTSSVTVTIDNAANDGQSGEGDNVRTDVEDVLGGKGNDTLKAIVADSVVNVLSGGPGKDNIKTRDTTQAQDRVLCGPGVDLYDRDPADAELAYDCETPATLP